MTGNIQFDAFLFGIISAVSLPLGAIVAMFWTPHRKMAAALMAFGGGALLAALTIDLVAESVHKGEFWLVAIGCIMGGLLYEFLNHLLNSQGGFLRKHSTQITHQKRKKAKELKLIFSKLGKVRFFRHLPYKEVHRLLPCINLAEIKSGESIFNIGEMGDEVFIVEYGEIVLKNSDDKVVLELGKNDVCGEMQFLKNETHTTKAVAKTDTKIWLLHRADLDALIKNIPRIASAMEHYMDAHFEKNESLDEHDTKEEHWIGEVSEHIAQHDHHDTGQEEKKHSNASLAIWLGILLDGIPESFVIGASLLVAGKNEASSGISLSLLAGLFLSNFPEALSSSVGMRENKYNKMKILLMWTSLMLITGLGAWAGNVMLAHAGHYVFPIIEGMAAGAMLTMIAETMMPEAFEKGGSVTGLSTLFGFLAAIAFKFI